MSEADKTQYAALIEKIKVHLLSGGVVIVGTYTKSIQFDGSKKGKAELYASMFKVGKDGSPLMQRGKHWDDISGCAIKFGRWVEQK